MRKIYALTVNVKKTLRQLFAAFENGIPCFRERNWKTLATSLTNNLIPEFIPQQKLSQMQTFTKTTKTFNGFNRWMMILITGLFVMLGSVNTNAQTILINPTGDGGFETGATFALNNWTVVNHTTNTWQAGAAATAFAGARSAFVSNDGGTTYAYTITASQTSHFYRDITVPAGEGKISLTFQWKGSGESGFDRLLVYTAPTTVTPVAGTPASSSTTLTGATLVFTQPSFAQTTYTTATVSLPASLAGTTFRLIFTWQNDASGGVSPCGSVDNISLTSAIPGNITSNAVAGLWSATTTWVGGVVPNGGDNVTIADGATVTIDMNPTVGTLTVGGGTSGILQYDATARTLATTGNVAISTGAVFKSAPTGSTSTVTTHAFSVGGNLTNNGTINFSATAGTSGTTVNASGALITFTGASNNTFDVSNATLTNLRSTSGVIINKGTANTNVLTFTPPAAYTSAAGATSSSTTITVGSTTGLSAGMYVSITTAGTGALAAGTQVVSITNGTQFVVNTAPTTALSGALNVLTASKFGVLSAAAINGIAAGFLTITNGTFEVAGTNAISNPFFSSTAYSIPSTGGFTLNNANATVTALGGSPTNTGLLKIIAGTYNIGTTAGNAMAGSTGQYNISGGTLNIGARLTCSGAGSYTQTAGTVNVTTVALGNTSSSAGGLDFSSSTSSVTISGGTINLVQASTATTPLDIRFASATINITGGTLNVGSAATATNFTFRTSGSLPAMTTNTTTNNKNVTLFAATSVFGNTTISTGTTINLNGFTLTERGSTFTNNGILTGTVTSSRLSFFGSTAQTLAGSGTITTNIDGLSIQNTAGVTITHTNQIITLRVNLFQGTLTGSGKVTMGTGAALGVTTQIGAAGITTAGGSFDVAPFFNLGTGTYTVLYLEETAARTTGFEIPATRSVSAMTVGNANNITLSGGNLGIGTLTLSGGKLITSSANLATITGTTTTSTVRSTYTSAASASSSGSTVTVSTTTGLVAGMTVSVTAGTGAFVSGTIVTSVVNTTTFTVSAAPTTALTGATIAGIGGWVSGPLAITLPASLVTGSTYNIPVGKSGYNNFELVNPTTNAGGTVTVQSEVFDANSGGTPGTLMGSINTSRYWAGSITAGAANFTNTFIRLNDTRGTLDGIASSTTVSGAYNHEGGAVSTLTTSSILTTAPASTTLPGFYVMGNVAAATLSNLTITPSGNQCVNIARAVSVLVTPGGAAISTVVLSYQVNGGTVQNVVMTNSTALGGLNADTWTGTIPVVSPTNGTVTWSVTATDANTLQKSQTGTSYADEPLNGVTATAVASVNPICAGSPTNLTASLSKTATATIGTAITLSASSDVNTAFNNRWPSARTQLLYTATELQAAGLQAGSITSIAFNINSLGDAATNANFRVKIGNTALSALTAFIDTTSGFTTVYNPKTYTHSATGLQTILFDAPFVWNGTSNIIVQVVMSGANATNNALTFYTATAANQAAYTSTAETNSATLSLNRLNIVFAGNAAPAITSVSWNNGGGIGNPVTVSPVSNTTYTGTVTASGCTVNTNALLITVNALPAAPGAGSFPSNQCGVGVPGQPGNTAFVTGGASGQYRWYTSPGGVLIAGETNASLSNIIANSISTTTSYQVSIFNGTCESSKITVTANVVSPDPVTASSNGPVCVNTSLNLTATVTSGGLNTYTYAWTASPAAGSGIPTSASGGTGTFGTPATIAVTPTVAGTYIYTVTGTDGGCIASNTVSVVVNPAPVVDSIRAAPSTICAGASSSLSVYSAKITNGPSGLPGIYCVPTQSGGSLVSSVVFGTINNSVTQVSPFYDIYPATGITTTTVSKGQTYPLTVTSSAASIASVWIDYNRDGVYAASEWQQLWISASSGTINITIPNTAVSGQTGMRIRSRATGNSNGSGDACTTFGSGSAQDYTINILNVLTQNPDLTYSWNNSGGSGATVSVTPSSTTIYTATALNTTTNCSSTAPVTVTVNPLPTAPSGTNSDQCGTAVPNCFVASTAGVNGTGIFRWYLQAAPGGTAIAGESGTALVNYSVSNPTTFYVSEVGTNGCESNRTQVAVTFNLIPDVLTLSASPSPVCLGTPITFSYTQTGGSNTFVFNYPSLSHTAGSGINIPNIDGVDSNLVNPAITVTATASGSITYTLRGYDADKGCISVATTTVAVNPLPVITSVAASPTTICAGATSTLTAQSTISSTGTTTLGTGSNTTTLSTDGTPYRMGNIVGNQFKNQYLFLGSELQAAGLLAGNITSVQLTIAGSGGGTLSNFTIKMGTTASGQFSSSTYLTGLSTVFTAATYPSSGTVTTGVQTHVFSTPFNWDGTSNIVLEMCAQLATTGSAGTLAGDTKLFAATILNSPTTTACTSTTGGSTSTVRPKVTFGGTVGTDLTNTLTWSWNNGGGSGNPKVVSPITTTVYTATATDGNGCSKQSATTATVTVNPLPALPSASDMSRCGAGSVTLSATGTGGTLNWYSVSTGGTSLATGGSYTTTVSVSGTIFYVAETSAAGCEGPRKAVTVTLTAAPTLVITAATATTFCLGGSVGLNAATGSNPSYVNFSWSTVPATGAGLSATNVAAITSMPTAAGAYTISVAANDGVSGPTGCASVASIAVTANPNPVITLVSATPATICAGATSSLKAVSGAGAGSGTIGTGTLTNTTSTPYKGFYGGHKVQMLYTASELTALGMVNGSAIETVGFNISAFTSPYTFGDFQIGMKLTSLTALTSTLETGVTNVLPSASFTLSGTAPFTTSHTITPFAWDGSSNLLVEFCFNNVDGGGVSANSASTTSTTTTGNLTAYYSADNTAGLCGAPGVATTTTTRPNLRLTHNQDLSGNYNWVWNPGALVGSTVSVTPGSTQSYTATATNPVTFCSTTSSAVNVTVLPVVANATATQLVICAGVSTTLSSGGTGGSPLTYSWIVDGSPLTILGTATTLTVSPTATTAYRVTVTDPCGNSATSLVTITVNALPTVSVAPQSGSLSTFCTNGAATVNSITLQGTSNASAPYEWKFNGTTISGETGTTYAVPSGQTGIYRFIVTSAGGCKDSASVSITTAVIPAATVNASPNPLCQGAQLTLTSTGTPSVVGYSVASIAFSPKDTTGATYLARNGVNNNTTDFNVSGTLDDGYWSNIPLPFTFNFYGVNQNTIRMSCNGRADFDAAGSTAFTGVAIPTAAAPNNYIGSPWMDLDLRTSGSLSYKTLGTAPNRTFAISWAGPVFSGADNDSAQIVLYEGTNVIEVHTSQFTNNVPKTFTTGIENAAGTAGTAAPGRNAANISLNNEGWRFTPTAVSYSWSGPNTFTSTVQNPPAFAAVAPGGTYTVRVSENNGCFRDAFVNVTVNSPATSAVLSGAATICSGSSTNLSVTITGGTGPFTVNYTDGVNGFQVTNYNSGDPIPVSPVSTRTYSLNSVLSTGGCVSPTVSGTALVTVSSPSTAAVLSGTTSICAGSSANLQVAITGGTSPFTVVLSDGTTVNSYISGTNISVTPSGTTTYTITSVTTSTGSCVGTGNTGSATITVNPVPTITTAASATGVFRLGSAQLTPLTYSATTGSPTTYSIVWNAAALAAGFVNVTNAALPASPIQVSVTGNTDAGTYTGSLTVTNAGLCTSSPANSFTVTVTNANPVWTGNTSTNWNTGSNWSTGVVPAGTESITIDAPRPNYPVLTGNISIGGTLDMAPVATLTIGSNTLTVTGGITNNTGTLIGSNTSNLVIGATSTLNFATGAGGTLKNLNINAGTTTLATALDITGGTGLANNNSFGTVTVASGAVLASGGFLTFKSNISGTARLAQGSTAGNYVTGDVTVERYIPQNIQRAWRMLSVPTKGGQKINQAWQEGAIGPLNNPKPGFGTLITTKLLVSPGSIGFDAYTSVSASLRTYNVATNAWNDVTATIGSGTTGNIETVKGYSLYVRGDRGANGQVSAAVTTSSPTVLRTTGTLYTGDQAVVSINPNKFEMIGNTYVSAVDFLGLARTNIPNTFYIWDPKASSNGSLGAYQTFTLAGGWVPLLPGSYGTGTGSDPYRSNTLIESGQAFFVTTGSLAGSIGMKEVAKTVGLGINVFRPATGIERFKTNLYAVASDNTATVADANLSAFDNLFSNGVDADDALKLANTGENFAIVRDNINLAIEARQAIVSTDTTYFKMWNMSMHSYRLEFIATDMNLPGLTAYLKDNFTGTSKVLDLAGTTTYDFTVNGFAASSAQDRFKIVYNQAAAGPLPVTFISISANLAGAAIKIDWKVAGERGIQRYEVERSADGNSFARVGTVAASGNNFSDITYSWMDATPLTGNNFYRIKSIGASGETKYTYIVKVLIGNVKPGYSISPNPVEGSIVNLQFKNQPQGRYNIRLMSSIGEVIFTSIAEHAGGNSTQLLNLPAAIARGAYQLEIIAPDKTKEVQNLFINTLK